jgi:transposase-like protein
VEELLEERGINVDHTTVWRRVQYYGPELEQRLQRHPEPTIKSWRVDETCVAAILAGQRDNARASASSSSRFVGW